MGSSRKLWGFLGLASAVFSPMWGCHFEMRAGGEAGSEPTTAVPAAGGEAAEVAEPVAEPAPEVADAPAATSAPQAGLSHHQSAPAEPADPPAEEPQAPATTGKLEIVCQFSDAWVAIVPRGVYRPNDEFLMQALIGFTTDPNFWNAQGGDWARYAPHAARQCGVDALKVDLAPGAYVVLVGWAGRFEANGGAYTRNGRIERVQLRAGQTVVKTYATGMLNHDWTCISCPYLAVRQDGRIVELGQVLVDRYTAGREGTDVRRARVDVASGRIVVTLVEREPEVSKVDAVELFVNGRALPLADGTPASLGTVDGARHSFSMGESVEVAFDATGIADGFVDAEIRVTGHYEPVGPLL